MDFLQMKHGSKACSTRKGMNTMDLSTIEKRLLWVKVCSTIRETSHMDNLRKDCINEKRSNVYWII